LSIILEEDEDADLNDRLSNGPDTERKLEEVTVNHRQQEEESRILNQDDVYIDPKTQLR